MVDFLCNQCGKNSGEEIDLALHEARAHDKRPVKCKKCGETFVGKTTLQNHMRKHKNCENMNVLQFVFLLFMCHHWNIISLCRLDSYFVYYINPPV